MISNQPKHKLHSQLDFGRTSRNAKVKGREVVHMLETDAELRNIQQWDIVRLFNTRGACLAAANTSKHIRPPVLELPTGAWYDPQDPNIKDAMDTHGDPDLLTQDIGASTFSQGCAAHSCLVDIEVYHGDLPDADSTSKCII
jgi:biotin/methionine sulfoxide reductase